MPAAAVTRAIAVEQPGTGRCIRPASLQDSRWRIQAWPSHAKRPHVAPAEMFAVLCGFVSVKLQQIGLHLLDDGTNFGVGCIDEQGCDTDEGRYGLPEHTRLPNSAES